MTINTPKRGLPKVEGDDNSRDYLKGAIAGGGLWEALETLDDVILETDIAAKGDLIVGDAVDSVAILTVGTNGQVLTADSAEATGMKWVQMQGEAQSGSAVGSTVSPTTTSTSYVDATDMSVTLTTTGGDLLAWFSSDIMNETTVNAAISLALSLDAAAEVGVRVFQVPVAANTYVSSTMHRFTGVAAGSHTIKGRWKTSAGTARLDNANRSLIVLEVPT